MTEPEIRTVYFNNHNPFPSQQKAIPWCTVHDYKASDDIWYAATRGTACHISYGGIDHLWWEDLG